MKVCDLIVAAQGGRDGHVEGLADAPVTVLAEMASTPAGSRVDQSRTEACEGGELAGSGEAAQVSNLGEDYRSGHKSYPINAGEQFVVSLESWCFRKQHSHTFLDGFDIAVELFEPSLLHGADRFAGTRLVGPLPFGDAFGDQGVPVAQETAQLYPFGSQCFIGCRASLKAIQCQGAGFELVRLVAQAEALDVVGRAFWVGNSGKKSVVDFGNPSGQFDGIVPGGFHDDAQPRANFLGLFSGPGDELIDPIARACEGAHWHDVEQGKVEYQSLTRISNGSVEGCLGRVYSSPGCRLS